jgi:hypothetical protein
MNAEKCIDLNEFHPNTVLVNVCGNTMAHVIYRIMKRGGLMLKGIYKGEYSVMVIGYVLDNTDG